MTTFRSIHLSESGLAQGLPRQPQFVAFGHVSSRATRRRSIDRVHELAGPPARALHLLRAARDGISRAPQSKILKAAFSKSNNGANQ
jgi:hypothetical protein